MEAMSTLNKVAGRNLLGLRGNLERRASESNFEELSPGNDEGSSLTDLNDNIDSEKYPVDINRNSITDASVFPGGNLCEVTTTEIPEIQEKKAKKKTAITSLRNFVRANAIVSHVEKRVAAASNTDYVATGSGGDTNKHRDLPSNNDKSNKRLRMSIRARKKRNRRSRAIQNEGKSLWRQVQSGLWLSVAGKRVELLEITLHDLCEAEVEVLKQLGHAKLKDDLDSPVTIPKECNPAVRRRWRHIINLGKKQKGDSSKASSKPLYPLFNIDLAQSIENEKHVTRLHEEQMAKLDDLEEDEAEDTNEKELQSLPTPEERKPDMRNRRNSDPILSYSISLTSDTSANDDDCDGYYDNNIRTFDTLNEEDEDNLIASKRKSRLIEALQLSSITASAVCILDKEDEFFEQPRKLPKVLVECVDFIETYALNTVGIFRTGGSKKRLKQMKADYDNGIHCVLTEETNPHDVAALFKEFLRGLPDPLLTRELFPGFIATAKLKYEDLMLGVIKHLVWLLPSANRDTLQLTLSCLKKVADHSQDSYNEDGVLLTGNKMDAQNLATLMAPNILHRCKVNKTAGGYQADYGINPEDTKPAIDIVYNMIVNHEQLFKISASEHDEILLQLLESDPETVDYILKRKPTAPSPAIPQIVTTNVEQKTNLRIDIPKGEVSPGRRPSSAGPRTRYSMEDVSFQKSFSFNQGPYKPFVRCRKESVTGSRPQSTRSDPPDRSSFRKSSSFGTSPTLRRKSSKTFADMDDATERSTSSRDSNSPRDSGVVISTPPFQRHSLRRSMDPDELRLKKLNTDSFVSPNASPSQTKNRIVFRKHNRDRDSRDSAYDSGMTGMFSNRTSAANSIRISTNECFGDDKTLDHPNLEIEESDDEFAEQTSPSNIEITVTTASLETVKEQIERLLPKDKPPLRKHSLPAFSNYNSARNRDTNNMTIKSRSLDAQDVLPKRRSHSDIDFTDESQWPKWEIRLRDSQFSCPETTL